MGSKMKAMRKLFQSTYHENGKGQVLSEGCVREGELALPCISDYASKENSIAQSIMNGFRTYMNIYTFKTANKDAFSIED